LNQIATLQDVMDYLGLDPDMLSASRQRRLQMMLDGAAAAVGKGTGRQFYPEPALVGGADTAAPVARTYAARGRRRVWIKDLRVATQVLLDGYELTPMYGYDIGTVTDEPATSIVLADVSPYVVVRPIWTSTLTITGRWGFATTPDDVKDVVLYMAARRYRRSENAYGDQVAAPDGAGWNYFSDLPRDIRNTLEAYRVGPHMAVVGATLG
jgi:hypothetical protein